MTHDDDATTPAAPRRVRRRKPTPEAVAAFTLADESFDLSTLDGCTAASVAVAKAAAAGVLSPPQARALAIVIRPLIAHHAALAQIAAKASTAPELHDERPRAVVFRLAGADDAR